MAPRASVHHMLSVILALCVVALSLMYPSRVLGQGECGPGWIESPGYPAGVSNFVARAACTWDEDASGPLEPRYIIAGTVPGVGSTPHSVYEFTPSAGAWAQLGGVLYMEVRAVAATGNGNVYAVGFGGVYLYKRDTSTWTLVSPNTSCVYSNVVTLPNGDALVSGGFSTSCGMPSDRIARYDFQGNQWIGENWLTQSDSSTEVRSMFSLPNGDVICVGRFKASVSSGGTTNHIVRYIAAENVVQSIGSGLAELDQANVASTLPNGDIVVAGMFTSASSPSFPNRLFAKYHLGTGAWETQSVSTMPSNSTITFIRPFENGDVILGGSFSVFSSVRDHAKYIHAENRWVNMYGSGPFALLPNGDYLTFRNMFGSSYYLGFSVIRHHVEQEKLSLTWTGVNNQIKAMATLPDGDIVVGGYFEHAGGQICKGLARYSPTSRSWTSLNNQYLATRYDVETIAIAPDRNPVVGKRKSTDWFGPSEVVKVDLTTGTHEPLGGELNDVPKSLAVLPNGDVIAGGEFTRNTDPSQRVFQTLNHIGLYSVFTRRWSSLGTGTDDAVWALVILPDSGVLAGGWFQNAGGTPASYIARFDRASQVWSRAGGGVNGAVFAMLLLPDGNVAVGGNFREAGGIRVNGIAKYNPSTDLWAGIGNGMDGSVRSLTLLPNGDLVAGGHFAIADGHLASRIARFSHQSNRWHSLREGVTLSVPSFGGIVYAVAPTADGDVLAGGTFLSTGQSESPFFARYTFGGPCHADLDCSGELNTQDIYMYIDAWFEKNLRADYNNDAALDIQDLFEFLSAWFQGC